MTQNPTEMSILSKYLNQEFYDDVKKLDEDTKRFDSSKTIKCNIKLTKSEKRAVESYTKVLEIWKNACETIDQKNEKFTKKDLLDSSWISSVICKCFCLDSVEAYSFIKDITNDILIDSSERTNLKYVLSSESDEDEVGESHKKKIKLTVLELEDEQDNPSSNTMEIEQQFFGQTNENVDNNLVAVNQFEQEASTLEQDPPQINESEEAQASSISQDQSSIVPLSELQANEYAILPEFAPTVIISEDNNQIILEFAKKKRTLLLPPELHRFDFYDKENVFEGVESVPPPIIDCYLPRIKRKKTLEIALNNSEEADAQGIDISVVEEVIVDEDEEINSFHRRLEELGLLHAESCQDENFGEETNGNSEFGLEKNEKLVLKEIEELVDKNKDDVIDICELFAACHIEKSNGNNVNSGDIQMSWQLKFNCIISLLYKKIVELVPMTEDTEAKDFVAGMMDKEIAMKSPNLVSLLGHKGFSITRDSQLRLLKQPTFLNEQASSSWNYQTPSLSQVHNSTTNHIVGLPDVEFTPFQEDITNMTIPSNVRRSLNFNVKPN